MVNRFLLLGSMALFTASMALADETAGAGAAAPGEQATVYEIIDAAPAVSPAPAAENIPTGDLNVGGGEDQETLSGTEILQFGFAFGYPQNQNTIQVWGFRLGLPLCGGTAPVSGVEAALIAAGSDKVQGVQASVFASITKDSSGAQLGLYNYCDSMAGAQIGLVNYSKGETFQFGLINIIEEGGFLPWCPLFNFRVK